MEFDNLLRDESSDNERDDAPAPSSKRQRKPKRQRQAFVSPSLILKAFPGIGADVLCQLSELDPPTPSDVLAMVPQASSANLARFFDLLSGTASPSPSLERRCISKQPVSEVGSLAEEIKSNLQDTSNER